MKKSILSIFQNFSRIAGLLFVLMIHLLGHSQTPIVKIDFDQFGRSTSEVNDPDYTSWVISSGTAASKTLDGVTFTVSKAGPYGDGLGTSWYKTGIQSPHYARLVCDGVTVKNGTANQGGQIQLTLSGLATGEHSLLAFLNIVDSENYTYSPIDIFLNGMQIENDLDPTVRALSKPSAKSIYLKFQATAGNDVVILFAAETSGTYDYKNVILNGIELNTPNIFNQANNPIPAHNDEHVELNASSLSLTWTAAQNAVSHNVYFGTDLATVEAATTASTIFKGNQSLANTSFLVNNLYSGDTYYWRVDEVLANNTIEKGNVWRFRPAQLAFPGAEGYGRYARGGRGGKVVVVTNLNDSGPGSFREAITNDIGPRTIVFNVSGLITLGSRLVSNQPYVTIAGQTAPGKGITIKSAPLGITGNDNIVQFLRVRLGGGKTYDGMGLTGANHSIIDHCSISWTLDEAFSSRGANNITLQRTLISEALNAAGHQNYPMGTEHGYAASIGGDVGSFHHNLLAHNYGRNWSLAGGLNGSGYYSGKLDITNNIVYNWGSRTTDGGANEVNFVGNYYKPGPGMQLARYAFTLEHEGVGLGMQRCYFAENVMPGYFNESNQSYGRRTKYTNGATNTYETFVDAPFFPSHVTTQNAGYAYKLVLSDVGCNLPVLDDHDQRMIDETKSGTYTVTGSYTGKKGFPDNEADSGGYENYPTTYRPANWDTDEDGLPNWYETVIGTNLNSPSGDFSDSNADDNKDGYTNLDYYLQWMSVPHVISENGEAVTIDLQKLSQGFTNGVTYSLSNVVKGTVVKNQNSVTYTPTAYGLGSFTFTVLDAEGDTMTRQVNTINGYATLANTKFKLNQFRAYPNPNKGILYIDAKSLDYNAPYSITDILGKQVATGFINAGTIAEITLHNTGPGIFFLKVLDPKNNMVLQLQKIVIQ